MPSVLVIDDDRSVHHLVAQAFRDSKIQVFSAADANRGLAAIREQHPDVVLLDVMLPETSGLEIFHRILAIDPQLPVIVITAMSGSDTAIEAMKLGAHDYVLKPLDVSKVQSLVRQAIENRRLMHAPDGLSAGKGPQPGKGGDLFAGRSPQMLEVFKAIGRVSNQNVTVLICGESGTGKELVARAIYQHSPRAGGPFLAVNCAALPDSLLESELFGHEKGSFTGADNRRIGKFEQCSGGTIFLDEVGDMSPLVQSKVLRLLQEQQFERVGGNQTITTDVRIITATNRDLEAMVQNGEFRADLYYRLNGFTIHLPPLRDRGDDIQLLLEHFLSRYRQEMGKIAVERISPDAVELLTRYRWPGNLRELQSVIKQALLNTTGSVIVPESLPEEVRANRDHAGAMQSNGLPPSDLKAFIDSHLPDDPDDLYAEALQMMERYLVTCVLRQTAGNQSKAAHILGITRGSLRNKIRTLGISIDHVVHVDDEVVETAK